MTTSPKQTPNATPTKKRKTRIAFTLVLTAIAIGLTYRWWWARYHVSTDNAQVEGHIVPIAARVDGYVLKVPVTDNQTVANKDLLVELDPRDFEVRTAQAEADYQQSLSAAGKDGQPGIALAQIGAAQASAAAATAQTRSTEAQIVEARANVDKAHRDAERARDLARQKMFSAAALDAAETAVKTEEARLNALVAQLKSTREAASAAAQQVSVSSAGLKAAQAKVLAAQASLLLSRNQLADTRVVSPAPGIVTKKAVEPGQMIKSGQTLMYLVPTEELWITANLKETELENVRTGQAVDIVVDAYPGLTLKGRVDSFSPATGARFTLLPPDNSTGNFTKVVQRVPVRIALDERPQQTPLRPGMSVNVVIATR